MVKLEFYSKNTLRTSLITHLITLTLLYCQFETKPHFWRLSHKKNKEITTEGCF